jgi:3-phenylpropionate/trans-cinnamate dioxygenase ferredoxin reductase subunit
MAEIDSIVVVGAGQAGGWAVDTLRREGFAGRVVLIGEEAQVPYERPPLSKGVLAGRQDPESCYLKPRQHYEEIGVELILGVRAERLDREGQRVELSKGEAVAYDRLILATGSRVRRLALPGAELPGVCYLRTLDESLALAARLRDGARAVLVGGGYIGMEVAATARGRGCRVTVVELQDRVMARVVPDELGRYLEAVHRENGVEILTGLGVEGFERRGEELAVLTSDGRALAADTIVVGIGIQPNVELAREAGLEVDDGVLVDEFGRSSDPQILAAGDVARHFNPLLGRRIRLESWQNAQNQAIVVAKGLCGGTEPYGEIPWFWSDQYDLNIQIAGLPEAWGPIVVRGDMAEGKFVAINLEDGLVTGAVAVNSPRDLRFARRLIETKQPVTAEALVDISVPLKNLL